MYQVKIGKDSRLPRYIPSIRKCYPSLPIGEIRRRIETGAVVFEQEPVPRWDPLDDLRGVDRLQVFCGLVEELRAQGAQVQLLEDDEPITEDFFRNSLTLLEEIAREVELDMEREAED